MSECDHVVGLPFEAVMTIFVVIIVFHIPIMIDIWKGRGESLAKFWEGDRKDDEDT